MFGFINKHIHNVNSCYKILVTYIHVCCTSADMWQSVIKNLIVEAVQYQHLGTNQSVLIIKVFVFPGKIMH